MVFEQTLILRKIVTGPFRKRLTVSWQMQNPALPAELLVATSNTGKIAELQELIGRLRVALRYLGDFPSVSEVAETGETFEQNAALKACEYALHTRLWTIADDSGLVIDALSGRPGVHSARYGGPGLSDIDRMDLVLREMPVGAPRSARFVCAIALANEVGEILFTASGICEGRIANAPYGTNGFGYDPIFMPDGFDQTFGELPASQKHVVSHRTRAVNVLIRYLLHFTTV